MPNFGFTFYHDIKPYVRMTRTGKYVNGRAQKYLLSQDNISSYMSFAISNLVLEQKLSLYTVIKEKKVGNAIAETEYKFPIPDRTPFRVEFNFWYRADKDMHYCDLDNLTKAMMDAGNKVLYWDDRWCDSIVAVRENVDNLFVKNKNFVGIRGDYTW